MGSKKQTLKAYDKCLSKFSFTYPTNYDGKIYEYNPDNGTMDIKPIPIIVELKKDDGSFNNKRNIIELQQFVNKDLKTAQFKFKHGDIFVINKMMPVIATLLGIKHGLKILYEKQKVK